MEKKAPSQSKVKGMQKDGIHFVMPTINTRASIKHMIRKNVLPLLDPIFERIGAVNGSNDIVDESVIEKNSWYMYGSKKFHSEPYLLTAIYDMDGEKIDIGSVNHVRLFSIRNKLSERNPKPEANEIVERQEKEIEEAFRRKKADKKILNSSRTNHATHYENIELVKKLVGILKPDRANNYEDWIRLGWCLRNIDGRLEEAWDEFSKNSPKYRASECGRVWNRMKEGGLGIGTLRMWAKDDNPNGFEEIMRGDVSAVLYESRSKTHYDVARVVFTMFQHVYVCSSAKGKFWYEYKNHRWQVCEGGITLRQRLSDEVWRVYHLEAIKYNSKAVVAGTVADQNQYGSIAAIFNDIAMKLRNCNFKENIMKECSELFYMNKFEDKLDADTNLIGFENGVYDLEEHDFRDGKPEDHVSFSTGVNYVPYNPKHPTIYAINNYLAQVLVNRRVREYVLKLFSTFISGRVKEQKFYIWTGSGSNSKSKLVELFQKSFGDYCCNFPITLLTQKRIASNAANGELARSKGKRFACMQEPSEDERINIGLMKELSGGDKILTRALYKDPFEFIPQFKMLLLCNHLPFVPSDDGGTWRRIRVVEFTSKFVEDPQAPNEFPIDYDLSDKMEDWRDHFMGMLIHYYKLYELEGISEPAEVLKCTTDYKEQNDHMSAFLALKIEKKDASFLTVDEAHTELRSWIKDDCIPIKLPSKPDFKRYLMRTLGKFTKFGMDEGFKGFKIKTCVPDEQNEDEVEQEV
jgi:P4 family phage/plasmid primase-like protien